MKINLSFPATGCQKLIEIADELKVRPFYEKRMGQEMEADTLGDEFKGYVVRITGGWSEVQDLYNEQKLVRECFRKRQTRFPHEAGSADQWTCQAAPQQGPQLLQT